MDEGFGWELEGVLPAGQLPLSEIICTPLINEIQALGERFILVVDDFKVIHGNRIMQVLQQMVTHLPKKLHLVLLNREDLNLPLARLWAKNQLTEVRAEDLLFSNLEADHFLTEVVRLTLSKQTSTSWQQTQKVGLPGCFWLV